MCANEIRDRGDTIGVIGLGAMGEPMAKRLLESRGSLLAHSRSPRPLLVEAGAGWASSPRELGAGAAVVLSVLPDLPELEAALDGPDGLLAGLGADDELLLLIASTSSAPRVRELAERLDQISRGRVSVVDCPVSGGVEGASNGTLSIMIGGSDADATLAAKVLQPCGRPVHLGPLGAGEVAKACNQLVVAATMTALSEATVLAERSGLDLDALWRLLGGGYAGSNLLEAKRDRLVAGDDSPAGIARYMVKDLAFARELADATGTNPALLGPLQSFFDEIVERGYGERDLVTTRRVIAER